MTLSRDRLSRAPRSLAPRAFGPRRLLAGALATAALAASAPATAQTTRVIVDTQAGIGYATNPFLLVDDADGVAFSELAVQPELLYLDELSNASLIARYRRNDYFSRYGSADSYGAEARGGRRLSSTLMTHARVSFDSSILGQNGFGLVSPIFTGVGTPGIGTGTGGLIGVGPIGPIGTVVPPVLGVPDITLIGLRQRQNTLATSLGGEWQMSPRDSLTTEVSAIRSTFGDTALLTSSRTLNATLGYSRALSARTSVGLRGNATWISFGRQGYSGSIYQPQVTLDHQVSETIRVSAAAGVLLLRSETEFGTERSTGFSGNLNACRTGARDNLCVNAFSDGQATGLGDVSRRLGGLVDYGYRLGENDTARATMGYFRISSTSAALIQVPTASYLNAGASYEHGFSRRVFGGVEGGYRRADVGFGTPSDVNVKVFVRARWGDRS